MQASTTNPTPETVDAVVVGGGVVGLASAWRLAEKALRVVVVERHTGPGRETTSRNSEVIHAGLYYPTASLKAKLSVRGNTLLYEFCERHNVPHRRCGKLVVACENNELSSLEALHEQAINNGVSQAKLITASEIRRLEPEIRATAAIHSKSTGIIDSHALVKAIEARAVRANATLLYRCALRDVEVTDHGYCLDLEHPGGNERLTAPLVVNCAGLAADQVAKMANAGHYQLHWCKGDYFRVTGSSQVARLVYPIPSTTLTGLGIHVTLDLAGRMRLGPDAEFISRDRTLFDVPHNKAQLFHQAAQRYLPNLRLDQLVPDTYGIRPKLSGPMDPWRDFVITEETAAGRPGWINLVGIESPGLTAALAIADYVVTLLR